MSEAKIAPGVHGIQPKYPAEKLTPEELQQIAHWLGEFIHPGQIPKLVRQQFGKRIAASYAYDFQKRRKWAVLIDRFRQEWMLGTLKVPLAIKRYRLERLFQQVERLDVQWERKTISSERYERRLRGLLADARLEMEEHKEEHTWFFTNIYPPSVTDEELLQRRAELLKRIQQFRLPIRRESDAIRDGCQIVEATTGDGETSQGEGSEVRSETEPGRGGD